MKYLILTEGYSELGLIDVLLEKKMLIYDLENLVYEQAHQGRQIDDVIKEKINSLPYNEKVAVVRIGDKLSDTIIIPKELKGKIIQEIKVCTKPEFEILHIIHRKKFKEYLSVKTEMKPCEFLRTLDKRYTKSYKYNYDYFNNLTRIELIDLLKEYSIKRGKTHNPDEKKIYELLKN